MEDDVSLLASEQENTADLKSRLWWITMIRGVAALGLGMGLLVWPASTTETLLRFMALHWQVVSDVRWYALDCRTQVQSENWSTS